MFYTGSSETERMRIDSSGRVLIGDTSSSFADASGDDLVIGNNSGSHGLTIHSAAANTSSIFFGNDGTNGNIDGSVQYFHESFGTVALRRSLVFKTAGDNTRMVIDGSGLLLMHGTSDSARIIPATDNVGYIGESTHRWQAIYAVNGSIQTSDEREKTEVKKTTLGLDFIKDLKPVSYKWIDGEQQNKGKDEREHQGLIAQQVAETVEKHGIDKNTFGGLDIQKTEKYDDLHGMSYGQFVAPLIKAIQEQQALIETLTARVEQLEN